MQITVAPGPRSPTLWERYADEPIVARTRAIALLVLAACACAAIVILAGGVLPSSRPQRARPQRANALTRERGAPGVAAAYGFPARCLSVTISRHDPTYARADFDHGSLCGEYAGYPTAIFHRIDGAWRPALEAIGYGCPVASLPRSVQSELAVCPRSGLVASRER